MKPVFVLDGIEYPVINVSWKPDSDKISSVTYYTGVTVAEDTPEEVKSVAIVWSWDMDLEKAVVWPDSKRYRILKGEDMMATPEYRDSLREFSKVVNPKPEGVEMSKGFTKGKQV